jgi:hypothetical protein
VFYESFNRIYLGRITAEISNAGTALAFCPMNRSFSCNGCPYRLNAVIAVPTAVLVPGAIRAIDQ